MNSPTVVRHTKRGRNILQVITLLGQETSAVFQQYEVNPETGRTSLTRSMTFSNERAAILEWQSRVLGAE